MEYKLTPFWISLLLLNLLINKIIAILLNTMRLRKTIIFGGIILCGACTSSLQNKIHETFSSFEGNWQLENSNTSEIWKNHDTFLSGRVIKIEDIDTLLVENLRIFQEEDAIYYEATVPSQNAGKPIRFKLTEQNNNTFQFENPKHDFPKKITYTFLNKKELKAIISGGNKQVSFNYNKVK